ncbi:ferrochelatase [Nevskia soli]|uniref:ferrochelatase n=1 Tax=Nevskia soli TaxID=418856 RepID=UPI000690622F|nr:ferrochelatase [Nevskia soli]
MTDQVLEHRTDPATGVLLINLGTPDAPTPAAIRRYLAQFLSDHRVVELTPLLWLPLLYGFILPFRPGRLVHAYEKIWTEEGSPLLAISKRLASGLERRLGETLGRDVPVALGMTYGTPSIATALAELEARRVRRIAVLPLYPQYSCSTNAAALDALFAELNTRRWVPELRTVNSYHDEPAYIAALAQSVRAHWQARGRGDYLLLSFHGLPQRTVLAGDPYYCQCQKTGRLLAGALELREGEFSVAFQSRFGKLPWVQPYAEPTIAALPARGIRQLDVLCPGFAADCLETLEEIQLRYAETFTAAGGTALRYIPALNDSPAHLDVLGGIVLRQLQGWLPAAADAADLAARQQRAAALRPGFSGNSPAG